MGKKLFNSDMEPEIYVTIVLFNSDMEPEIYVTIVWYNMFSVT